MTRVFPLRPSPPSCALFVPAFPLRGGRDVEQRAAPAPPAKHLLLVRVSVAHAPAGVPPLPSPRLRTQTHVSVIFVVVVVRLAVITQTLGLGLGTSPPRPAAVAVTPVHRRRVRDRPGIPLAPAAPAALGSSTTRASSATQLRARELSSAPD